MSEYLWVVQMDIPPELEAQANAIYDNDHIPAIAAVKGCLGVTRYALVKEVPGVPKYAAHYRISSPEVRESPEWVAASDSGDWKPMIRPHTRNVIRALYKTLK